MANQEFLLRTAIEHIDNKLKTPKAFITHSMITDAIHSLKKQRTIPPLVVISALIEKYGEDVLCLLPPCLKLRESEEVDSSSSNEEDDGEDDGVVLVKDQSMEMVTSIDKLWKWICGAGKRELLKAKTLDSALNVIKPFCVLKTIPSYEEKYGTKASSVGVKTKLEEIMATFNKFQSNGEESNQSIAATSVYQFEDGCVRCCFFGRKSICKVLINMCQRHYNYETEFSITSSLSRTVQITAEPVASISVPNSKTLSTFLNRGYNLSNCETRSRILAKLLKPIVFVKENIPICDIGRFVGKRGCTINGLKSYLESLVVSGLGSLKFMLSLSILEVNSSVKSPSVVTLGVWITDESVLKDMYETEDDCLNFIDIKVQQALCVKLKLAVQTSITGAAAMYRDRELTHTNRLPHLIEMSSFSHISDKERARKGRYDKEKARWKKMKNLNIRTPRQVKTKHSKSDLWPVKGMKDIVLCPEFSDALLLPERKSLKWLEKEERRKQFLAVKANKGTFKRFATKWDHDGATTNKFGLAKHQNRLNAKLMAAVELL